MISQIYPKSKTKSKGTSLPLDSSNVSFNFYKKNNAHKYFKESNSTLKKNCKTIRS